MLCSCLGAVIWNCWNADAEGEEACDGQCPRDLEWIKGKANIKLDWIPAKKHLMKNIGQGGRSICCVELDLWEANKVSMQLALQPVEGYESQIVCDGDTWMKRYEELVSPSSCNEWLALVRYFSCVSES